MFTNTYIHAEDNLLDTSLDLTGFLAAKMKISLSLIPGSGDNIKEFMKRVDDDVSHMSSLPSSLSTLGQVLKSTKAIMDQVSKVLHLSNLKLIVVIQLIEEIRYTRYSMHRGPLFPVSTR
jgi:hypothetical protein